MRDNVGICIMNYLREHRITMASVADKFGVSRATISGLLNGKRQFGAQTALQWNKEFGFSVRWLLTGEGLMFEKSDFAMEKIAQLEQQIIKKDEELELLREKYDKMTFAFLDVCEKHGIVGKVE